MKTLLILNGILTPAHAHGWGVHAENYFRNEAPGIRVLYRHYWAGPIPMWTHWVVNPREVRHLVHRLGPLAGNEDNSLLVLAHSNGTNIAVPTMRELAKLGLRTEAAILMGSALPSRVDRSGLLDLANAGHLGRAFAYCDPKDRIASHRREWVPFWWGGLGALGFLDENRNRFGLELPNYAPMPPDSSARFVTRMFEGLGHNGYTASPATRAEIFNLAKADFGLAPCPS